MTASAANGDTALVVRITNASPHAITLLSITDPQASGSMFFRATTLIASTQPMRYVASIVVRAHQQLTLSYEHLGAMIAGLHQRLRAGSRVPLDIKWSDSASVHHDTFVYFRVVKGPAHLHFVMGG
jgi:copper(I)-binding protein